jgi:predicted nucleic acid-binding Zn ribbon protein
VSEPPEEGTVPPGEEDPLLAAAEALARARRVAREKGLRPGRPGRVPRQGGAEGPAGGLGRRRGGSAKPDAREPQPVGAEIERLVTSRGWEGEVQVGSVIGRWPTIVGPAVAQHVKPTGFTGTSLTVQADSTAWATQMQLLTSSVLARIETEVGPDVVTEIVVRGPGGPSWRKGQFRSTGPGPRDTYG